MAVVQGELIRASDFVNISRGKSVQENKTNKKEQDKIEEKKDDENQ